MVTVEAISIVFTGLSISLAAFYYIMTLRNTRKNQELQLETRQTQLFMQILQELNSEESQKAWAELLNVEFKDYDDFIKKYDSSVNPENFGKRGHIWWSYNAIGYLLMDGMISIERINKLLGTMAILQWEKWGGIIAEIRANQKYPQYYDGFEYLAEELIKYNKEHPVF